jgi:prepilin-type N-terminal cleavage/methylation domain-containing protein
MMKKAHKLGFTLIEVLVALAITSLLTVILYTSFTGLTTTAGALEGYSEKYRQIVLFMNQLSSDVTGAFYSAALPYADFSLTERNLGGESISELAFSCFSHQFIDIDPGGTDIVRVTYKPGMDDDGNIFVLREIEPNLQVPAYEETLSEPVLTDISSFLVRAVTGEDTEDEEWETKKKLKLPDRIRITVAFTDGRSFDKDFFIRLTGDVNRFGNSGKRSK